MNNLFIKKSKSITILTIIFVLIIAAQLSAAPAFVGNVLGSSIPDNYATYWNQVTSENAGKWGVVEANRDSMTWGTLDSHVSYAAAKGMPFKFHCLVWGSQQPPWISGLSASEQLAEVIEWMQAVSAKYTPAMIDVVNEPLHAVPVYSGALGGNGSTGWDWVIKSFQLARQYFPNSKLFINEYGVENDGAACDKYVAIIKLLKDRGLIDGIGIQTHCFNLNDTPASTLSANLAKLTATGLKVYVSEFDLQGDDATQAARYREKFPIYYNNSSVAGITLWGYISGQTWKSDTHLVSSGSIGTAERPAMAWLKTYLKGSNVTPAPTAVPTPTPTSTLITTTPTPTPTTSGSLCVPSGSITIPYAKDGAGEFCWETTALNSYINSWNVDLLEINGINYTNKWTSVSSIPRVNNKYVIHYKSSVAWGHFEAR